MDTANACGNRFFKVTVPQAVEEIAVFNYSKSDFCIAVIFGIKRVYFAQL